MLINRIETESLESLAYKVLQRNNIRNKPETTMQNLVSYHATSLSERETEEYEERAAIMEFDGNLSKVNAEAAALQNVINRR